MGVLKGRDRYVGVYGEECLCVLVRKGEGNSHSLECKIS